MADNEIARLELRIDSVDAIGAAKNLDELKQSSVGAEKQASKLSDVYRTQNLILRTIAKDLAAMRAATAANQSQAASLTQTIGAQDAALKKLAADYQVLERVARNALSSDTVAGVTAATAAKDKAADSAKNLTKGYEQLTRVAMRLLVAFGGFQILRSVISTAADFEATMAMVKGVSGATAEEFARLETQARKLGASTRFTAEEAGQAQLALSRAGFKTNEVLAATADVLNLAIGANLGLGRAAEITAITLRQFSLAAEESTRVADVLVNTSNNATTDVEQLAEAMKYVGPIASGMGFSLEQTAAALGALSDKGLQASNAGTGLRGVLAALSKPTGMAHDALERLAARIGMTVDAFDLTQHSLVDVMRRFKEAEAAPKDFFQIFGRLQTPAAIALTEMVDKMEELGIANTKLDGTAEKLAKTAGDQLKGSLQSLDSAVKELFLSINDGLVGKAFRGLVDLSTQVVRVLSGMEDETNKNSTASKILAMLLKVLAASALTYALNMGRVAAATIWARIAAVGFGASLRGLKVALASTGIGLAIVLVGELASLFMSTDKEAKKLAASLNSLDVPDEAIKALNDEMSKLELTRLNGMADALNDLDNRFKEMRVRVAQAGLSEFEKEALSAKMAIEELAFAAEGFAANLAPPQIKDRVKQVTDEYTKMHAAAVAAEEATKKREEARKKRQDEMVRGLEDLRNLEFELVRQADIDAVGDYGREWQVLYFQVEDSFRKMHGIARDADIVGPLFDQLQGWQDRIKEAFDEREAGKSFNALTKAAEAAGTAINTALAESLTGLQTSTLEGFDSVLHSTQREFETALQNRRKALESDRNQRIRETQDEYAQGEISAQDHNRKITEILTDFKIAAAKVQADVEQIAVNRFGATLAQDAHEAARALEEMSRMTQLTVDDVSEFEHLSRTAMRVYREQLRLGLISQDQFLVKQHEVNASFGEFVKRANDAEYIRRVEDAARDLGQSFGNAFEEFVLGTKSAKEAARDFAIEVARILLRKAVTEPLVNAIVKGLGTVAGSVLGSADGNVFRSGAVQPFANGGVVSSTTMFPMLGGRTGMMGEAGPEAIIPLKRMRDGKLGVSANIRPAHQMERRPFVSQAVSSGSSRSPTVDDHAGGTKRTLVLNQTIVAPDPNGFRKSQTQIARDITRASGRFR